MVRKNNKKRNQRTRYLAPIALTVLVLMGVTFLMQRGSFSVVRDTLVPIRHVRIEGAFANVEPEELEAVVMPLVRVNYITVDIESIERALIKVPWVMQARVTRIWPNTVQIDVMEQEPIARWGNDSLIGRDGKVFRVARGLGGFLHLPLLLGPEGREGEVLAMLEGLNQDFSPRNTHVTSLKLSGRLAWTATLSDGPEIAYGNQDPRQATLRLLSVLPGLGKERIEAIRTIDMRYPRGFAVTWKPGSEEQTPGDMRNPAAPST
jgi:cell division protein FtsQ